jgi:hypothetical protein
LKRLCFLPLLTLAQLLGLAQYSLAESLKFDLSQIGFVLDGKQICEDNGRLQDFPSKMMNKIIGTGPGAIPVLITMLTDTRPVKTREPLICYWPAMTVGDVAFCLLSNLFSGPNGTTLPGADWNDLLGKDESDPAWVQLSEYIRQHGRKSLQSKWEALWVKYKDKIVWSPSDRCFKLKAT